MKRSNRILLAVMCIGGATVQMNSLHATARPIRAVVDFDNALAESPMSVVVFWRKSQGPRELDKIVAAVSRDKRFKEANLKFFLINLDRNNLLPLEERYKIHQLPQVQIFLRTQPMRNAFKTGCFDEDELKRFIERFLGRSLTNEINRKRVKRHIASRQDYYAADYYNPFYMMPYFNYSPPSDWPDQGPEWVGIEVD